MEFLNLGKLVKTVLKILSMKVSLFVLHFVETELLILEKNATMVLSMEKIENVLPLVNL